MPDEQLIVLKQLPIIEERLKTISDACRAQTQAALSLVVTEETRADIKKTRAELNAQFNELEEQRKALKKAYMAEYDKFEAKYKTYITDVFKPTDVELKKRLDEVEAEIKSRLELDAAAYFSEYAASRGVDWLTFDRAGIKIGLSDTSKKLRERAKSFVDSVVEDLLVINTQEFKDEVLVEYKKTLNPATAIITVTARHDAIEREKRLQAEADEIWRKRRENGAKVQTKAEADRSFPLAPPTEAPIPRQEPSPEEQKLKVCFTIIDTKPRLIALKRFLIDGGYQYE